MTKKVNGTKFHTKKRSRKERNKYRNGRVGEWTTNKTVERNSNKEINTHLCKCKHISRLHIVREENIINTNRKYYKLIDSENI